MRNSIILLIFSFGAVFSMLSQQKQKENLIINLLLFEEDYLNLYFFSERNDRKTYEFVFLDSSFCESGYFLLNNEVEFDSFARVKEIYNIKDSITVNYIGKTRVEMNRKRHSLNLIEKRLFYLDQGIPKKGYLIENDKDTLNIKVKYTDIDSTQLKIDLNFFDDDQFIYFKTYNLFYNLEESKPCLILSTSTWTDEYSILYQKLNGYNAELLDYGCGLREFIYYKNKSSEKTGETTFSIENLLREQIGNFKIK